MASGKPFSRVRVWLMPLACICLASQLGAQFPVAGDPTWTEQQELTAADGAMGDQFGNSVSVSGDTAVIGAADKNAYQGAAYVFVQSGGIWSQQQELIASDGMARASNDLGFRFTDVTSSAGIQYRHNSGAFGEKYLPETLGPG